VDPAPVRENITSVLATPTKQNNQAPSAIAIDLAKFQASSMFYCKHPSFQCNRIKRPTYIVKNAKEEREQRHVLQEILPIIAQEDPYLICLLGQQKYINIMKTTAVRWVERINPFFLSFLLSMNLLVNMV
jgi:hypothetical protein